MKKLLILLICGFTFTQTSIQTKEFVIYTNNPEEEFYNDFETWGATGVYDIKDYIELVSGAYKVELILVVNPTQPFGGGIGENLQINNGDYLEPFCDVISESNREYNLDTYGNNDTRQTIYYNPDDEFSNCTCIRFYAGELPPENTKLTFHITGLFEGNQGFGVQGDMNGDETLDIIDVVVLVSAILGE